MLGHWFGKIIHGLFFFILASLLSCTLSEIASDVMILYGWVAFAWASVRWLLLCGDTLLFFFGVCSSRNIFLECSPCRQPLKHRAWLWLCWASSCPLHPLHGVGKIYHMSVHVGVSICILASSWKYSTFAWVFAMLFCGRTYMMHGSRKTVKP